MPRTSITEAEIHAALFNAATDLFIEKGITGTEMKEIAEKAGLSRSTLYRYAIDKNQLAFLVTSHLTCQLTQDCISFAESDGASGKEQLMAYCLHMVDVCESRPELLRLINEFDSIYTGAYPDVEEARDFVVRMQQLNHHITGLVLRALADHSISHVENPSMFATMLGNMVFALALRFIPREAHYIEEQHYQARQVISLAIHAVLDNA